MDRLRHITIWITTCAIASVLGAPAAAATGLLTLAADPPGAHLAIRGPVTLSGAAPLPIGDLPEGEYELRADGFGLPAVRGRFVRAADGLERRAWAGPLTLLWPPGLTHIERGERRGWAFLGAATVAAVMAIDGQKSLWDAEDDRDRAIRDYERAISETEIKGARYELLLASQETEDYAEVRNLWLVYLGTSWLGAAAEAMLLTPQPTLSTVAEGEVLAVLPRPSRAGLALRSALVPGAGQRYMGRGKRANLFYLATAALAWGALGAHESFLDARRDQADAQRRFDEEENEEALAQARARLADAADRVDDKQILRWSLVGAAAAVYLWNLLDAFHLEGAPRSSGLTATGAPTADGALLCVSWRLP